jgi:hypothetical protein
MISVSTIEEIADELDCLMDDSVAFLNSRTGEIFTIYGESTDVSDIDYLLQCNEVEESDEWLALPKKFDLHEWQIMRDFAHSFPDDDLSNELLDAVHGSKAFRRFQQVVDCHDLRDEWFKFKKAAITDIVVHWLEVNEIAYEKSA